MSPRVVITGGIACGKSLVTKFLNNAGYPTLDADDVVHELIPDPVERKRIATEVFADPEKRHELEARIHPLVAQRLAAFDGIVIIPLLFETHWEEKYDIICCVASKRDLQISRMMSTRGYTREEALARLTAQMPVEEKAARSHYTINNNSSAEELEAETKKFIIWLKKITTTKALQTSTTETPTTNLLLRRNSIPASHLDGADPSQR